MFGNVSTIKNQLSKCNIHTLEYNIQCTVLQVAEYNTSA